MHAHFSGAGWGEGQSEQLPVQLLHIHRGEYERESGVKKYINRFRQIK